MAGGVLSAICRSRAGLITNGRGAIYSLLEMWVGIVEEREASRKDEELPALALVYWYLFQDTSRAAALAEWNGMSYPQKDRVARKTACIGWFLLLCVAVYLEYLFDLHSVWITFLGSSIASFVCLYPLLRWQEKQRRLRAG
jgi:hypothetical protein